MNRIEDFLATLDTSGLGEDEITIYEEVSGLGEIGREVEVFEIGVTLPSVAKKAVTAVKKTASVAKKAVVKTAGKAVKVAKAAVVGVPKGTQVTVPGKAPVTTTKGITVKVPAGTTLKTPTMTAEAAKYGAQEYERWTGKKITPEAYAEAVFITKPTKAEKLKAEMEKAEKLKAAIEKAKVKVKAALEKKAEAKPVTVKKSTAAAVVTSVAPKVSEAEKLAAAAKEKYPTYSEQVKAYLEKFGSEVHPEKRTPEQIAERKRILGARADQYGSLIKPSVVTPPAVTPTPPTVPEVPTALEPGKPTPILTAQYLSVPAGTKIIRNGLVYTVEKAGKVYVFANSIVLIPETEAAAVTTPTQIPWTWIAIGCAAAFAIWAATKKKPAKKEAT